MAKHDMRGVVGRRGLDAAVAQAAQIEVPEQPLASAQHDGDAGDVQLVDETCTQPLLDGVGSTADLDVLAAGRLHRPHTTSHRRGQRGLGADGARQRQRLGSSSASSVLLISFSKAIMPKRTRPRGGFWPV